jgi:hypothetical protein
MVKRMAIVETEEKRTHSWVEDLTDQISGLRDDIRNLMVTMAKYAGGIGVLVTLISVASLAVAIYAAVK